MKLTVLIDNNTIIDRYFLGEPGVSYYIEDENVKILFDVGYSDAFIINAYKMGIDLRTINYIVLSHGHIDHTWGLDPLVKLFTEAIIENQKNSEPRLIGHPSVFDSRWIGPIPEIGSLLSRKKIARHFKLQLSENPVWITERLVFLGHINRTNSFEGKDPIGCVCAESSDKDDFINDDTALVYRADGGLVIITSCSHSGIVNIVETAKEVCNEERVIDIIGGLHLLNPSNEQLAGVLEYIKQLNLKALHACHCTDLASKIALSHVAPLKEVGSGLELSY